MYCRINSGLFRPSSGLLWVVYIKHVRFVLGDSLRRIKIFWKQNIVELRFRNWKQIQKYEIGNNNITEVDFNFIFIIIPSLTSHVSLPVRIRDFCLLQNVQTVSEFGQKLTKPPIQAYLLPNFARVNQRGREADISIVPRAEVKNGWSLTSTTLIWLQGVHWD